jgi:primosomal protein N' (replication factor Y)
MSKELARRRALGFPPAAALAVVTGAGAAEYASALRMGGVASAATLTGDVLLRAADWDTLGNAIAATPRPKGSRLRIEVDPPRL